MNEELLKSEEAEQSIIASILANNKNYDKVASFLNEEHFYYSTYSNLFKIISDLINAGMRADNISVKSKVNNKDTSHELIDKMFIAGLSIINPQDYGHIVLDRYKKRELVNSFEYSMEQLKSDYTFDFVEEIGSAFDKIANDKETESEIDVYEEIEERIKNKGRLSGLSTGISGLNDRLDGFGAGKLYILAGRSGMGKSAVASYLAKECLKRDIKTGIFSLEMTTNQFKKRIISSFSRVDGKKIEKGLLDLSDYEKLRECKSKLNNLLISDKSGVNFNYIRSVCRTWVRKGCKIIFIDYLGLIDHGGDKNLGLPQRIAKTTAGLKVLAKELNIPIVLLCQINRETEKRTNPRPMLSDLKDSGSIEQDADAVIMVYNPMYYLERDKPDMSDTKAYMEWQEKVSQKQNKGELIVAKNRFGEAGNVDVFMELATMTFADIEQNNYHGEF